MPFDPDFPVACNDDYHLRKEASIVCLSAQGDEVAGIDQSSFFRSASRLPFVYLL